MLRTLLVDDDAAMRHLLRLELEGSRRFQVIAEAADGMAGVLEARRCSGRLDLVLLDVNMPVLGGVQALPLLRHAAPSAMIVFLTMDRKQLEDQPSASGATAILDKALRAEPLVDRLLRLAEQRRRRPARNMGPSRRERPPRPRGDALAAVDPSRSGRRS